MIILQNKCYQYPPSSCLQQSRVRHLWKQLYLVSLLITIYSFQFKIILFRVVQLYAPSYGRTPSQFCNILSVVICESISISVVLSVVYLHNSLNFTRSISLTRLQTCQISLLSFAYMSQCSCDYCYTLYRFCYIRL